MKHIRRAVIFDLYGTLVDLQLDEESPRFWNALAADFFASNETVSGELLKRAFTRLIEKTSKSIEEGFILDAVFSEMLEEFGLNSTQDNLTQFGRKFRKHSITHLGKKVYTDDLLSTIRNSGYKLGLVSNTEALLTAYDLQVLSLEDKFDAIILSSNTGVKKPDKRIFEIVVDRLAVRSEECTFVGDSFEADIVGALNAGIDPVFLTASTSISPECREEVEERIVCAGFDLNEIIAALGRIDFALPRQE